MADRALSLATSAPLEAQALAQRVIDEPDEHSVRDRIVAFRARGLAARTLMQYEDSLDWFARAFELASREGMGEEAARTRLSRAPAFGFSGRPDEALVDIDAALTVLTGNEYDEARSQKAGILALIGRFDEALAQMNVAVRGFRRSGNQLWEARARANRSYIHVMNDSVEAGEREARAARALYRDLGHGLGEAYMEHHLAILAGLRGDIPTALSLFEEVATSYRNLGVPSQQGADAHVTILLAAHLGRDARRVAEDAIADLRANGNEAAVPELLLAAARAAVMLADHVQARAAADEASARFTNQGLPAWAACADLLSVTARFAGGERSADLQAMAEATAESLARRAWMTASRDAQLLAGRVALSRGQSERALQLLQMTAMARRGQSLVARVHGCHARALVEVMGGRPRSAQRALAAGLDLVDEFREALGATEIRVGASGHAEELAQLGLELAFAHGRAAEIFSWSERHRAATSRLRPVRPPKDQKLAQTLARLRLVSSRLEQTEGRQLVNLLRQQRELEEQVRQITHLARGGGGPGTRRPSASGLRPFLRGSALVQLVARDGELHAVVVTSATVHLRRLAPLDEIRHELAAVRFGLGHLARRPGSRSAPEIRANLQHGVDRLDQLILGPLRPLVRSRRLVISPPGELQLLPWGLLATGRGQLVTIAPSAAVWLRAGTQAPPRRRRCVLAAGPGLQHAEAEVTTIAGMAPGRRVLLGAEATAGAVARALTGASLAHLACHGHFRSDNPSFSSLQLADGPLYVYDIERLQRPPHVIVLSACDSGRATASVGDELSGLIAALLSVGTQAVIASVLPVRDDDSRAFMIVLHRHLAAGSCPAKALAATQQAYWEADRPEGLAIAGSFLCFGAGWPLAVPAPALR